LAVNINNIGHIGSFASLLADIIGLTTYWTPQNPIQHCQNILEFDNI